MDKIDLTGTLAIGTLLIALIIGVVLLLRFLRKPQNRHPMAGKRERNYEEMRDEARDVT